MVPITKRRIIMILKDKTYEELINLKKDIEDELSQRILNRSLDLLEQTKTMECPMLIAMAEAMLVCNHNIKPHVFKKLYPNEEQQLGYLLANWSRQTNGFLNLFEEVFFEEDKEELTRLAKKILKRFEISDFIFAQTHYDECDNGFYFRRS